MNMDNKLSRAAKIDSDSCSVLLIPQSDKGIESTLQRNVNCKSSVLRYQVIGAPVPESNRDGDLSGSPNIEAAPRPNGKQNWKRSETAVVVGRPQSDQWLVRQLLAPLTVTP